LKRGYFYFAFFDYAFRLIDINVQNMTYGATLLFLPKNDIFEIFNRTIERVHKIPSTIQKCIFEYAFE